MPFPFGAVVDSKGIQFTRKFEFCLLPRGYVMCFLSIMRNKEPHFQKPIAIWKHRVILNIVHFLAKFLDFLPK